MTEEKVPEHVPERATHKAPAKASGGLSERERRAFLVDLSVLCGSVVLLGLSGLAVVSGSPRSTAGGSGWAEGPAEGALAEAEPAAVGAGFAARARSLRVGLDGEDDDDDDDDDHESGRLVARADRPPAAGLQRSPSRGRGSRAVHRRSRAS